MAAKAKAVFLTWKQDLSLCKTCRHCWASTSAFLPTHGVRHASVHGTAGSKATFAAPLRAACTLWAPSMQQCAAPLVQQACASHRATPPMGSEQLFRPHIIMAAPPSDCGQHPSTHMCAGLVASLRCTPLLLKHRGYALKLGGVERPRVQQGVMWGSALAAPAALGESTHNAYACNQQQRAQQQSGALRPPLGPVKGNCGGHRQA